MPSVSPVKLLPGTIRWRIAPEGQWLRAHFPTPPSETAASTSFEDQFPLWRLYGMLTKKIGHRRPRAHNDTRGNRVARKSGSDCFHAVVEI
jgi:hypothetical protein